MSCTSCHNLTAWTTAFLCWVRKLPKTRCWSTMIWPQAGGGMARVASSARCLDGTLFAGDVVLFSDERHKWACGRVKCHLQYCEDRRTVLDRCCLA